MEPGRKTILWLMALFTLAMLPQLVHAPVPVAIMTVLPLAWRLAAELRGWKQLPAIVRHGMTVMGLLALFAAYGNIAGRRAAVSLLMVMLSLKLVECYRIRDARLVASFSLFLCTTQFLFTQGILMPFYGAAVVVLALVTLTHLHRKEAWAHQGEPPMVRVSLLSELGFSLRLLALAVPLGLAFFVLFPRLASPLWGIPEATLDSKSGLSDSMSPGSIQSLFMDDTPAFRVEFAGELPRPDQLYWRGPVFWRFDGSTWKSGFYGRKVAAEDLPPAGENSWIYTVQLEPNERNWLFTLDYPVKPPADARISMDFQVLRREPVIQLMEYTATSEPDFIDSPRLSDTLRAEALTLPEDSSPRTRELIRRWRLETTDDKAFAERVLRHFNEQEFHYSLESPLLGSEPVDEFLFDTRMGYCEHYASSFTVMMRLAGIPARVVTGYQGGWYNALGDYLLVRQSDAHAWSEIWLAGSGWVRVDPTAAVSPLRIQRGSLTALSAPRHLLDYSWLRSLRNSVDIVQQRWNDYVIEYGASRQARLLSPLGLDQVSPAALIVMLFVAIAVLGALLLPLSLRVRGPSTRDPLRKIWERFLRRLKRAGFESIPSLGPMELAEAASERLPAESETVRHIAELYSRSRYSPRPPPLAELKQAVGAFRPGRKAS
jgi:transglutaminase-like putative cysteine protease